MSEDGVTAALQDLLQCLLGCCEKAACIARTIRKQEDLFGLLIEEKCAKEFNLSSVQDFKTLADVIVQETIKQDVGKKFPALSSKVFGEEQNSFQNTIGEQIKVELTDSVAETTALLCKVLNGKNSIAESLAAIIHSDNETTICYSSSVSLPINKLGIWIDPIDSTAEYIQAKQNEADQHVFEQNGLKSVCVLIGVYDLDTGNPIMGIINQPFYEKCSNSGRWESNIYWGICYGDVPRTSESLSPYTLSQKVIVTSSYESKQLQSIMQSKYSVFTPAGAGYKCLLVAQQRANLYVLSLHSTHFWDTCGPHAILAALGGGIVSYSNILNSKENIDHSNIQKYQLTYSEDLSDEDFKNTGGIIAYREENDLFELLQLLKESGYRDKLNSFSAQSYK